MSGRPSYATCTEVSDRCPLSATTYGYYPILEVNTFFAVFFGILLIIQLIVGIRTRTWTYMIALGIGTFGEAVGYIGRILMHYNPWNSPAFQMQICCLILSPSLIAGAIYLTMKHLVLYCGPEHSRLKPRLYPWIFIGCDFGSIVLQAIGGGMASAAGKQGNKQLLDASNALIVAGIGFQVATMAVAGGLVADFFIRRRRSLRQARGSDDAFKRRDSHTLANAKTKRMLHTFCAAVGVAYTAVLIRCIYRLPEMAGGWGNPRMRNEQEFLLLDGMMVAIGVLALTVVHPGYFFPPMRTGFGNKNVAQVGSEEKASSEIQPAK